MIKTVFLDMDGVLADFITPSMAYHGHAFDAKTYPKKEWLIWKVLGITEADYWKCDSYDLWRNLPVYPWAKSLVKGIEDRVGRDNVCLLTSPSRHPDCIRGKRDWIAEHFHGYVSQTLFGGCKHFCAHPSALLIDDSDANCEKFAKAGGRVITFPRVWNSFGEREDPAAYTLNRLEEMTAVHKWVGA